MFSVVAFCPFSVLLVWYAAVVVVVVVGRMVQVHLTVKWGMFWFVVVVVVAFVWLIGMIVR